MLKAKVIDICELIIISDTKPNYLQLYSSRINTITMYIESCKHYQLQAGATADATGPAESVKHPSVALRSFSRVPQTCTLDYDSFSNTYPKYSVLYLQSFTRYKLFKLSFLWNLLCINWLFSLFSLSNSNVWRNLWTSYYCLFW